MALILPARHQRLAEVALLAPAEPEGRAVRQDSADRRPEMLPCSQAAISTAHPAPTTTLEQLLALLAAAAMEWDANEAGYSNGPGSPWT